MFNTILQFFKDGSGYSNLRLNSTLMTVTICICLIWITLIKGVIIWEAYIALFAIAMGAKVAQKFAENKGVSTNV